MNFLWFIIIGTAAGYLAGKFVKGGGFGLLLNLIIGIIGGVLGGWIFNLFGVQFGGIMGSLVTATLGAIVLLWIAYLFQPRRKE